MELVKSFGSYLFSLGYSKNMVNNLPVYATSFLSFTGKNVEQVNVQDLQRFHNHLEVRPNRRRSFGGLSESYIRTNLYAVKLFFKSLCEKGVLSSNPLSNYELPKVECEQRKVLTEHQIKQLYATCENYRERVLLGMYYSCGLRRNEGINLNLNDVDLKQGVLLVREGKGGKERKVPMSKQFILDLECYLSFERSPKELHEKALLLHSRGGRLIDTNRFFKELLFKANELGENIPIQGVSLHNLRHSVATHLLHNGMNIYQVKEFLGHASLESTQIYTRPK
jgi:integrase/recombinase XerD